MMGDPMVVKQREIKWKVTNRPGQYDKGILEFAGIVTLSLFEKVALLCIS